MIFIDRIRGIRALNVVDKSQHGNMGQIQKPKTKFKLKYRVDG